MSFAPSQPLCTQPILGQGLQYTSFPHGLEHLAPLDYLIIEKTNEVSEIFADFPSATKYFIRNKMNQDVLYAAEFSAKECCQTNRPFQMKIFDGFKTELLYLERAQYCKYCCCTTFTEKVFVYNSSRNLLGLIEKPTTFAGQQFLIKNSNNDIVLRIKLGWSTTQKIMSADGATELGTIHQKFTGFRRELFSGTFGNLHEITFPVEMDVGLKALLICATFAMDVTERQRAAAVIH